MYARPSRRRRVEILNEIRRMALENGEVTPEELIRKYRVALSTAYTWLKEASAMFDDVVYIDGRLLPKVKVNAEI